MVEKIKQALISLLRVRVAPPAPRVALLRRELQLLRRENGAFVAASGEDYNACWVRDQVYSTYAYYYLGEIHTFATGLQVVFDILHNSREKIERAILQKPERSGDYIHAKFDVEALGEITDASGHHQVDAIGLFLFVVARAQRNGVRVIRDRKDREMLQLLVSYLAAVRYFAEPDNGMWEEGVDLHASSIGAAVTGLRELKYMHLAVVPEQLIAAGEAALARLLPNESPSREADLAQLSLLWPYRTVDTSTADTILARVKDSLVQSNGINRYLDDNYYRSDSGISAEWTMGFFWLAIIYADRKEYAEARYWFERGMSTMTPEGHLPELYHNGTPNLHTPLAWAHSLALIAGVKIGEF